MWQWRLHLVLVVDPLRLRVRVAVPGLPGGRRARSLPKSLDDVDVQKDGVKALTGAVADVATSLDAAVAAQSAKLQPQVDGIKTAFTALQASLSDLTAENVRQMAPAIKTALAQVRTATTSLTSALSQSCPSS